MPLICYVEKNFRDAALKVIHNAIVIIEELQAAGYTLTLRQLYYQFVSRDLIPNNQKSYKRLGHIVSDARRAGLIDWHAIEDRTRHLRSIAFWSDPGSIVSDSAHSFNVDKWADQPYRVEVWVEKDALVGVLQRACAPFDVPYFSCRGFVSDSECWAAALRLRRYADGGQIPLVLHLGDHDPSGCDMSRDILERVQMFARGTIEVRRIALTPEQIEEYDPPPNPAKQTDSRYEKYAAEHGHESWELDALNPTVIGELIEGHVKPLIHQGKFKAAEKRAAAGRELLEKAAERWPDVATFLAKPPKPPRRRKRKPKKRR